MESERDCAKVEVARSSRARSTKSMPIANWRSSIGLYGMGPGNHLQIGNPQLEIGNDFAGVAQSGGGTSLRN